MAQDTEHRDEKVNCTTPPLKGERYDAGVPGGCIF